MNNQPANRENAIIGRKASGETELFDVSKLQRSLQKAGAEFSAVNKITEDINKWIYSGVTTKKIYSRAFSLLRREQRGAAMRYKLKQAIMELGPTGYPFENLIGEIFRKQGFNIEVGVVVEGNCQKILIL